MTFLLLFTFVHCNSQYDREGVFFLEKNIHKEEILEADSLVRFTFHLTNAGPEVVEIQEVIVDCGCILVNAPQGSLSKGAKAQIHVDYEVYGRPGPFEKVIQVVYADDSMPVDTLLLSGNVRPVIRQPQKELRYKTGNLHFPYSTLNLGIVTTKDSLTRAYELYNAGEDTLIFAKHIPSHPSLKLWVEPLKLPPGELGTLRVKLDSIDFNMLGFNLIAAEIPTSEFDEPNKPINIQFSLVEYFPPIPVSQLANYPLADYLNTELRANQVVDTATFEFPIFNSGGSDLNIHKVELGCGCLNYDLASRTIAPGDSTILKIQMTTDDDKGVSYRQATVFTNDPRNPHQSLMMRAAKK